MKKLIYFTIISTLFIACEEDFPVYDGSNPDPMDTIMVDPQPMDTMIVDPEPMDTMMVDPEPMDTMIVDPEPMDTMIVDLEPMDTMIVDPEPMDTMIVDPEPMDTMIVDPEPMDTMIVDPEPTDRILVNGLTYGNSDKSFDEGNSIIVDALNAIDPIKIIAEINHTDNAASVNEILNPTQVILFGNPNLGTPLMQKNQLAGLDLPQKLLLFEDDDAQLKIAYNSIDYLTQRHGLEGVETLENIAGALNNFAGMVADELITIDAPVNLMEGIIIKNSLNDFEETYTKLIGVINANTSLRLIAELDHQANATSVDLELAPTRLVIFGNPDLGTPLMQNAQTVGIDLPQKMLVYETETGQVNVAYNDPAFLVKRHSITDNEDILNTITNALDNISKAATY